MKNKPQPKREIIATHIGGRVLEIDVLSEDAKRFVTGLEDFGQLSWGSGYWTLVVSRLYDTQEVLAYINSYNDEEEG